MLRLVARRSAGCLVALASLLMAAAPANAERLPIRTWTLANGLAHETVRSIDQDSRGFLWIGTQEGVSRFDGETFVTYGVAEGLPGPGVWGVAQTADGRYWIATDAGLVRFDPRVFRPRDDSPDDAAAFTLFAPAGAMQKRLRRIRKSRNGDLLVASWGGLARFNPLQEEGGFRTIDLGIRQPVDGGWQINDVHEDAAGNLWVATRYWGLIRVSPDGATTRHLNGLALRAIAADESGDLWVVGITGLYHLRPGTASADVKLLHHYLETDGIASRNLYAVQVARDGRVVAAGAGGISLLRGVGASPRRVEVWSDAQGLESSFPFHALAEDGDGNLWVGSSRTGLSRIALEGFTLWQSSDGVRSNRPSSLLLDRRGTLHAYCASTTDAVLQPFDGRRFSSIEIPTGRARMDQFWGWSQLLHQSKDGGWWLPTGHGLWRYDAMPPEGFATAAPKRIYTKKDGLPANEIFRLFEDSRGDLWISAYGFARWERESDRIIRTVFPEGNPDDTPAAFAEDHAGNVWSGFYAGDLVRHRGGRFDHFSTGDGLPDGGIYALHVDAKGRLWVGSTEGGAARVDEPDAPRPIFIPITSAQGLASNSILAITEDLFGRIYFATGRGVDRLDPETGLVRHYTSEDGLGSGLIELAQRDSEGNLWFSTPRGLSRLVPMRDEASSPPPILLTDVLVGGERIEMNRIGDARVEGLTLDSDRRSLEIRFVSLDFQSGERPRYQYRLDPVDSDWSQPTADRGVNLAHLSPGSYRFAVRAVDREGQRSGDPAAVEFHILRPVYLRWWFLAGSGLIVTGAAYGFYRQRLERLLAVERVRIRIATDLHDDIGSSLTQIAIQSEVLKRSMGEARPEEHERLTRIAAVSSEMVDSMSDIVWAINPKRDRLHDLVGRMRRFARDTLDAREIALEFPDPQRGLETALDPDMRRDLYLILKESVTNAARHAGCATVDVSLGVFDGRIRLRIHDDGRGYDTDRPVDPGLTRGGHGLGGLRRRAEAMGAELLIESAPGAGTTLTLTAPLSWSGRRRRRR